MQNLNPRWELLDQNLHLTWWLGDSYTLRVKLTAVSQGARFSYTWLLSNGGYSTWSPCSKPGALTWENRWILCFKSLIILGTLVIPWPQLTGPCFITKRNVTTFPYSECLHSGPIPSTFCSGQVWAVWFCRSGLGVLPGRSKWSSRGEKFHV